MKTRIAIIALAVVGFIYMDDFQEWRERSYREKREREKRAELRHFEDQLQRYYELKREGVDPAEMFEPVDDGRYDDDTYRGPYP
jgi:hypothetical protein